MHAKSHTWQNLPFCAYLHPHTLETLNETMRDHESAQGVSARGPMRRTYGPRKLCLHLGLGAGLTVPTVLRVQMGTSSALNTQFSRAVCIYAALTGELAD